MLIKLKRVLRGVVDLKFSITIFITVLGVSLTVFGQQKIFTISGTINDKTSNEALSFVTVAVKNASDSPLVTGTITNEKGLYTITGIKPGDYLLEVSFIGYKKHSDPLFVGSNSEYLDYS